MDCGGSTSARILAVARALEKIADWLPLAPLQRAGAPNRQGGARLTVSYRLGREEGSGIGWSQGGRHRPYRPYGTMLYRERVLAPTLSAQQVPG
jgi:hypothetical protein